MNKNLNDNSFGLRLVIGPYLLQSIIVLIVIISSVPYIAKTHDWTGLEAWLLILILLFIIVYFGTRYRVWWLENAVVRRTAGFPWALVTTTIKVENIKKIEQETSDIQTLVKLNRPLRRITIYGTTSDGMQKIDISLKHFNLDDVRKLMKIIHDRRPDLQMPKGWV